MHRGCCQTAAALALFAGLSLASAACAGKETPTPAPEVTVQAATVQRKAIQNVVSSEAVLYPRNQASIVPKISAPIEKFYVNRGDRVHAGELLAVLENKDLTAAVEQAEGTYEQAQAAYATATRVSVPQQVQTAQLNVKATKQAADAESLVYQSRLKLYRSGAIARNLLNQSHVAYVQAENQYQLALATLHGLDSVGRNAAIQTAKAQLASAKGQYQAALANLQYSQIRSPITGVVTDRPLYEGQMATAGQPMMTVMDLSQVIGRLYLSPQQAASLKVGDPATIAPAAGRADVPAKVTVVSPALDPNSTTVQVWVEARNPGGRLKPGATVEVSVVAETVKNALVVPAEAVLTADDGATSVMVIGPGGNAHQTSIKTGIREGAEIQILSGLEAGERVVSAGAYGLPDGAKVRVTNGASEP